MVKLYTFVVFNYDQGLRWWPIIRPGRGFRKTRDSKTLSQIVSSSSAVNPRSPATRRAHQRPWEWWLVSRNEWERIKKSRVRVCRSEVIVRRGYVGKSFGHGCHLTCGLEFKGRENEKGGDLHTFTVFYSAPPLSTSPHYSTQSLSDIFPDRGGCQGWKSESGTSFFKTRLSVRFVRSKEMLDVGGCRISRGVRVRVERRASILCTQRGQKQRKWRKTSRQTKDFVGPPSYNSCRHRVKKLSGHGAWKGGEYFWLLWGETKGFWGRTNTSRSSLRIQTDHQTQLTDRREIFLRKT